MCGDVRQFDSGGPAYLETAELTFRGGDLRLRIPFAGSVVSAEDGVLTVTWADGTARFHLGKNAVKWLEKIKNPKSVVDKIGIRDGMLVTVLGIADETFLAQLAERDCEVARSGARKDSDVILCGFETVASLGRIAELRPYLKSNGAIWTVFPKGRKDISQAAVMEAGKAAGLVDTKVVGFSETHSALKWVIPVKER